jgi:hypothetical protein
VLIAAIAAAPAAAALTNPEPLARAYDLILDARMDEAAQLLRTACGQPPAAPAVPCQVLQAVAAYWQLLSDPEDATRDATVLAKVNAAVASAEAWVAREPKRAEAWFYLGGAYGTRVLIGLTGKDLGQAEGESADDTLLIVADVLSKWEPPKPTGTIADVSVSAKGDQEPKITLKKTPLVVAKTESKVITPAKGKKAETIKEGDSVSVRYVGVNGRDGKTFDSSYKSGGTVDFELKQGQMIPGFITGLVGKKMGDRVLITIPYTDAYGAAGRPDGGINGGDTLVFVVDLVKKAAPPQG